MTNEAAWTDPATGIVVNYEAYLAPRLPAMGDDELKAALNDFIEHGPREAVRAVSAEMKRRGLG